MDITSSCTQSSVLVVAGKGGVGKSTVSATLARLAARSGLSVPLVGRSGLSGGDDETASQRSRGHPVRAFDSGDQRFLPSCE
jgi:ABC-type dipeptide/oligopeptide/nickel transport system ATPase subunit